jgi:hypothetical protein
MSGMPRPGLAADASGSAVGSKMAVAGAGLATSPVTQVRAGDSATSRPTSYGSPCGTWAHQTSAARRMVHAFRRAALFWLELGVPARHGSGVNVRSAIRRT